MRSAFALALLLGSLPAAAAPECSLDGQGDVALCEKIFWRSRIVGALLPAYTVMVDRRGAEHALTWNLSFDIPKDFWQPYFSLGEPPPPPPGAGGRTAFLLNLGASALWVPARGDLEARAVLRVRMISLVWPANPVIDPLHLWVGLGAFGGTRGFGPRLEVRIRVGHLAWGGLALVAGFEPDPFRDVYTGDFSVGFDAPFVWWW